MGWKTAFWIILALFIAQMIPWKKLISGLKKMISKLKAKTVQKENIASELAQAFQALVRLKCGASIIIERASELDDFLSDAINIDAIVSSELIVNIFEGKKSPLHDGALIIENGRIKQASAYINLLSNDKNIPKQLGTRHRSAIGISEKTDCIAIIVSEETSKIIISKNGTYRYVSLSNIEQELIKEL